MCNLLVEPGFQTLGLLSREAINRVDLNLLELSWLEVTFTHMWIEVLDDAPIRTYEGRMRTGSMCKESNGTTHDVMIADPDRDSDLILHGIYLYGKEKGLLLSKKPLMIDVIKD